MPLAVLGQPFDHRDWIFELKWDGFRALAYVENGRVRLISRKRNAYKTFGVLCDAIAASLQAADAILDGEIVNLDADGRPQFLPLLRRRSPQHFVAFDVLWLNGRDLTCKPLIERKRVLRSLLAPVATSPILFADYFDGGGIDLYQEVCRMDLEGIVAKRKDGLYTPDETSWVKIRNPKYSQMEGRRELFEKRAVAAASDGKKAFM
jgi:bifunctional non-homologous end joining protein LigD